MQGDEARRATGGAGKKRGAMARAPNYIVEYWRAIQDGSAIVGEYVRKAYAWLVKGLEGGTWRFDARKAARAVKFVENFCHHSNGRNDLLKLELWERAMVQAIFGIVGEDGCRVFREVVVIVARKNGKTLLAAAIIACCAYIDGEYGAEIYCLAPKLDQSELVYKAFWQMCLAEPELKALIKKRRADLYIAESNTSIKPLAFSSRKSDGYNPLLVVNDEIAAWPAATGLKQYEVMKSAIGARRQPLILSISTAGYVNDGPYDELVKRATALLNGNSREKHLLPLLYMIDDPDKWHDIDELRKANPNMGVSVQPEFFADAAAIAEASRSAKAEYMCKYCNIKQNSSIAWLQYDDVERAQSNKTLEDFRGCYALGGFDLSQTTDLTAASVVIERGGVLYVFTRFWMPTDTLDDHIDAEGVPYDIYRQQGHLHLSGDAYVDYADVLAWYEELRTKYEIYVPMIGYDRWMATNLVKDMEALGYRLDDVNQGYNLSPIMVIFEGLLKAGQIKFCGNNNLLKQHLLNTAIKQQLETRRMKPVKIDARAHIDGFVSLIDALTVRDKWYEQLGALLKNEGI